MQSKKKGSSCGKCIPKYLIQVKIFYKMGIFSKLQNSIVFLNVLDVKLIIQTSKVRPERPKIEKPEIIF